MELCIENNHNHACIVFSNFRAHGNSVILAEQIVGRGVSLSDSICHEQTKSVSLFEGLLTLPNGHLTIKVTVDQDSDRRDSDQAWVRCHLPHRHWLSRDQDLGGHSESEVTDPR